MGILLRKDHGELAFSGITKLGIVGFLIALSSSFVITVWAIYLNSFLNNISNVGFISAIFTFIAVASYFLFIPLIEKTSKSKILSYSILAFAISYLVLGLTNSFTIFLIIATVITIFGTLRSTSFGLIIKDSSKKSQLSKNEGLIFTFINIAFVIGPLIVGLMLSKYGINTIFLLASVFALLALGILKLENIQDDRKQKKVDGDLRKNFVDFFKDKDRLISYTLGGGVGFWWILIYLFLPLMIIDNGLPASWVGYFLFAIPLPLILLEYKFSKISDKKGPKKLFQAGFLIASIAALASFFMAHSIFAVMGILITASIGLAMLEPTVETYFFKISTKKEEQRFYGPYKTRLDVFGFLGKTIPALLLLFLPFKYIFLVFSVVMFSLFLLSFKAKQVI